MEDSPILGVLSKEAPEPDMKNVANSSTEDRAETKRDLFREIVWTPGVALRSTSRRPRKKIPPRPPRNRVTRRPMEISTNVRPPRLREVIQVPKKLSWCILYCSSGR